MLNLKPNCRKIKFNRKFKDPFLLNLCYPKLKTSYANPKQNKFPRDAQI
ncbi:hypothetical protein CAMRE0001_2689 [Campylobacter rectus RM3267]|uniref:Uncharacterized protein n=1 Tax=Campylobacter rectus RM3267 TaxID=553218 RepID=B9D3Z5_CAMRE|nr:hypothetical protein CAMRE0001_2689 [Campylobacter rectus RM3267]